MDEIKRSISSVLGSEKNGCTIKEFPSLHREIWGFDFDVKTSGFLNLEDLFKSEEMADIIEWKFDRIFVKKTAETAKMVELVGNTVSKRKREKRLAYHKQPTVINKGSHKKHTPTFSQWTQKFSTDEIKKSFHLLSITNPSCVNESVRNINDVKKSSSSSSSNRESIPITSFSREHNTNDVKKSNSSRSSNRENIPFISFSRGHDINDVKKSSSSSSSNRENIPIISFSRGHDINDVKESCSSSSSNRESIPITSKLIQLSKHKNILSNTNADGNVTTKSSTSSTFYKMGQKRFLQCIRENGGVISLMKFKIIYKKKFGAELNVNEYFKLFNLPKDFDFFEKAFLMDALKGFVTVSSSPKQETYLSIMNDSEDEENFEGFDEQIQLKDNEGGEYQKYIALFSLLKQVECMDQQDVYEKLKIKDDDGRVKLFMSFLTTFKDFFKIDYEENGITFSLSPNTSEIDFNELLSITFNTPNS